MNDDLDDEGTDPGVTSDESGLGGDTVSVGGEPDVDLGGDTLSLAGEAVSAFGGDTISLTGESISALAGFDDEEGTEPGDDGERTDPGLETP